MKKFIIIFFFIFTPLYAEKIERLGFYNLQEILEDDTLTYKIIKGCVSLNSAVTEIIKDEHPDLANEFFKSANYLYPFGILVLKKIKNTTREGAEKEFSIFSTAFVVTSKFHFPRPTLKSFNFLVTV